MLLNPVSFEIIFPAKGLSADVARELALCVNGLRVSPAVLFERKICAATVLDTFEGLVVATMLFGNMLASFVNDRRCLWRDCSYLSDALDLNLNFFFFLGQSSQNPAAPSGPAGSAAMGADAS
jgi:hypothetical protein